MNLYRAEHELLHKCDVTCVTRGAWLALIHQHWKVGVVIRDASE